MSTKNRKLEIPEETFDRRNRKDSWIASILFHVALLLPMLLITCSPATEPEELTLIEWGGGGDPNVNAPVGPTPKGEVDGGEQKVTKPEKVTEATETPKTTPAKEKIYEPKKQSPKTSTKKTESSEQKTSTTTTDNNEKKADAPKGNPDGEGSQPASGSGKGSASGFGLGAGRSWIVHPRSTIPGTLAGEFGTVVVSYVVKPDGRVTSISKVSGPTSLFNKIKGGLSRARANVAEPGSPDIHGTGTITFR